MTSLIRLALQVVLFFMLLSVVIGIFTAETGPVEKLVLVAIGALLVWLASLVRRLGVSSEPRSA